MTVVGTNRTNYGNMYPDIDYKGISLGRGPMAGLPGPLGPTNGFGALDSSSMLTYGVAALAAYWLWKKYSHKIGL